MVLYKLIAYAYVKNVLLNKIIIDNSIFFVATNCILSLKVLLIRFI